MVRRDSYAAAGRMDGFSEQALSNLAFSYDKAGMQSSELLQSIFNTAAARLHNNPNTAFKPQVRALYIIDL